LYAQLLGDERFTPYAVLSNEQYLPYDEFDPLPPRIAAFIDETFSVEERTARGERDPEFGARFYRSLAVLLSHRLRDTVKRLGYGAYRIGISHWEIVPEPDLKSETPEEALRRGSKFALAVRTAPDNATLTFWIYPDSFHAYRILQAACQAESFIVAARPLPDGVSIAGSPDGTRSAGQ
jgi:hypothetical protein